MAMPNEPQQRRPGMPSAPVIWAIAVFVLGLTFNAGIEWQKRVVLDARVTALEGGQATTATIQAELSGMRADIRNLGNQVAGLGQRVDRLSP